MLLAEIVIDLAGVLVAVGKRRNLPGIAGRIQTITDGKVIRERSHPDVLLNQSRRVGIRSIRVPAKNADRLQQPRRGRGLNRIARHIDGRVIRRVRVGVNGTGEESKIAVPRGPGEHRSSG